MDDREKKVITMLKRVRSEKGLSIQDVVDMCEENGDYVSFSTVKRVFSPDSENMSFRYDSSIRPIAKVLLGLQEGAAGAPPATDDSASEGDALRSMIEFKNHMIEGLESGIKDRENELSMVRASNERIMAEKDGRIQELRESIKSKDEEIDSLKTSNKWRTIVIAILVTCLILFMATAIRYLAWDLTHPTQGYFQWETSSVEG